MKYYKTSKFTKAIGSTGFFTIIACLLIAIGAIGWFTLSKSNNIPKTPSDDNIKQQEYSEPDNTYNNDNDVSVPESKAEPTTDVNDNVSDVPYIQEEIVQPELQKQSYILPIKGNISKGFSDTALQYSATYQDMRLHTGIDILCAIKSDIKSVGSGIVKSVTDDTKYGKIITIEYDDGIAVKYCGMGSVNVKENDKVATGDIIGTSGEVPSECADKPHIHIEVLIDGKSVSPLEALGLE